MYECCSSYVEKQPVHVCWAPSWAEIGLVALSLMVPHVIANIVPPTPPIKLCWWRCNKFPRQPRALLMADPLYSGSSAEFFSLGRGQRRRSALAGAGRTSCCSPEEGSDYRAAASSGCAKLPASWQCPC